MNRRNFLASILAAGSAPFVVRAESLMATRVPTSGLIELEPEYEVLSLGKTALEPIPGARGFTNFGCLSPTEVKDWAKHMAENMAQMRDQIIYAAITGRQFATTGN